MIKTSHIGSLPFLNLDEAIDFNHAFTIPVLSTLPLLHANEFMLSQVQQGISGSRLENFKIHLSNKLELVEYTFPFSLLDKFKVNFQNKTIKWQILGPCTLLRCLHTLPARSDIQWLLDWHLTNIINFQKELKTNFNDIYLFLDEPMWHSQLYPDLIQNFYQNIYNDCEYIGIHCCAKIGNSDFLNLPIMAISLDLTQVDETILRDIKSKKISLWAGILNTTTLQKNSTLEALFEFPNLVLTPACGLAFSDQKKLKQIPYLLKGL